MASVTKQDIPQVAKFMGDLWELIKKYYIPENSDSYWNAFLEDSKRIWESCGKEEIATCLLNGVTSYLEKKGEKKNVGKDSGRRAG